MKPPFSVPSHTSSSPAAHAADSGALRMSGDSKHHLPAHDAKQAGAKESTRPSQSLSSPSAQAAPLSVCAGPTSSRASLQSDPHGLAATPSLSSSTMATPAAHTPATHAPLPHGSPPSKAQGA